MHFLAVSILLALEAAFTSSESLRPRSPVRVPLTQRSSARKDGTEIAKQSLRALSKRAGSYALAPETLDGGFWFGSFTAGAATNLSLLIDTGSSDAAVNPGLYKPTSKSQNLHKTGRLQYETTEENGCGVANISYGEYIDSFSFAGLTSSNQTFANVVSTPPPNNGTTTSFPHDGLVGFAGIDSSELKATPFFTNLCNAGTVDACRFGLAFNADGTGEQILGGIDESLFSGNLSTAKIQDQWQTTGDAWLGGKKVLSRQNLILDSGTVNVVGPPGAVQALFDAAGIQSVNVTLPGCTEVLTGYYPCDSPPTVGFSFPSESDTVFNILSSAFNETVGTGGNCTAIVSGIDFGEPIWIVGQAFFQGKYVDFNVDAGELGFASLKGSNASTGGINGTIGTNGTNPVPSNSAAAGLLPIMPLSISTSVVLLSAMSLLL